MKNKTYTTFSLEDFLTDEFFTDSVRNPTPKSIAFWEDYINSNPGNIAEFYAAKRYILSSDGIQPLITDQEVEQMWAGIAARTGVGKRKTLSGRRYFLYTVSAIAACALIVISVFAVIRRPAGGLDGLAAISADTTEITEARLVLSDSRTVVIEEQNASITYGESVITVSEKEISREESAGYNQLFIPRGKMSKLVLSDGTKVWVNANTRVVYPVEFSGRKREIFVDGEVFLDVVPDKRPFIVLTGDMEVAVLGTRFNVRSRKDSDMSRVVLVEGSVKIVADNKKSKAVLKPNQMFEAGSGGSRIEEVDVRRYASWIDGLYFFDKEKLSVVAGRLSDYYAVKIVCGERAGSFVCSGKLDLKDNIEEVLYGLTKTMSLTYEYIEDIYIITLKTK